MNASDLPGYVVDAMKAYNRAHLVYMLADLDTVDGGQEARARFHAASSAEGAALRELRAAVRRARDEGLIRTN